MASRNRRCDTSVASTASVAPISATSTPCSAARAPDPGRHRCDLRHRLGAGQHGGDLVLCGDQAADRVELLACRQGLLALGGERIEARHQLAHHTSDTFDQVFEVHRRSHS
jgi:hypothetical protein